MNSFKQFCQDNSIQNVKGRFSSNVFLHEFETYKLIPGTKNSFRKDSGNTNTTTIEHSHVYAQPNGKGKELYSVGCNGKGHDGSSRIRISQTHADFFRSLNYNIPRNNILECLNISDCIRTEFIMLIIENPESGKGQ